MNARPDFRELYTRLEEIGQEADISPAGAENIEAGSALSSEALLAEDEDVLQPNAEDYALFRAEIEALRAKIERLEARGAQLEAGAPKLVQDLLHENARLMRENERLQQDHRAYAGAEAAGSGEKILSAATKANA